MSNYQKFFLGIFLISLFGILLPTRHFLLAAEAAIEITRDVSASSIGAIVQAGSRSADFNIMRLNNKNAYAVKIDWLKVSRGGGTDADFDDVSIYYLSPTGSRTQLGATQYSFASGTAYFDNVALTIPANSSSTLAVSASVSVSAINGDIVTWSLASADHISISISGTTQPAISSGTATGINRTILGNGPDTTAPATPTGIKVESVNEEPTLRVSWVDPTDSDLQKIAIYRSLISGQKGLLVYSFDRGVGIVPVKTYDDKNIITGTTYYYSVKAIDFVGNESTNATQYLGIVYGNGLNIFLDSSSATARSVNASSSDISLAAFKFLASNVDAEITNLKFEGMSLDRISRLKLYVNGTLVASTTSSDFIFYNDGTKLIIDLNASKVISLKADIPSTAYTGDIIAKVSSLSARRASWFPISTYGMGTAANKISVLGTTPPLMPIASSPASAEPSSVSTADIPEGALIRAQGGFDVFIVKYVGSKKFKRLILSPSVFNNYGHLKWSDIRDVNQAVVDAFATSELVRAVGDDKVYKLYPSGDEGQKRWIKTASAFAAMGFDADSIYEINSFDRDSYLTGSDLQ